MSPIDFPDLLEERSPADHQELSRGRRHSSRLVTSALRSRSRSRSHARAQRRSASCQPTERTKTAEEQLAEKKKKRRSLSRPPKEKASSSRSLLMKKEKKLSSSRKATNSELVDLTAAKELRSSKKTRTPSPSKRRSTLKTSNQDRSDKAKDKEWGADIINLVDHDDEDYLFGEIIGGKNPAISHSSSSKKKSEGKSPSSSDHRVRSSSKSRKTSPSSSKDIVKSDPSGNNASPSKKEKYAASSSNAGGSPRSVSRFPNNKTPPTYSDEEFSESDDGSESENENEEEEESNSVATNDLLDQVKSRMEQQRLMEEVQELRKTVEKKDAEIEQLTGQLRMAISTKCDLVIAHTELERLHEMDLKQRDLYAEHMKRSNLELMELRAEIEKEFMNELNNLSSEVQESEDRRKEEVAEKDQVIRLLQDKIRRLELTAMGGASARRDDDKVKYYKKKLGVYDQ